MVVYKIVECFFMIEGVLGLSLYCLVNLILIKPCLLYTSDAADE